MSDPRTQLLEVALADKRFAIEAYEFLCQALVYTQKLLGRSPKGRGTLSPEEVNRHHVSGPELLEGIRRFALDQYGRMAAVVFRSWGITRTDDFGEMVFRLIEAGQWHRLPSDRIEDFHDVYNFDEVFVHNFEFHLDESE